MYAYASNDSDTGQTIAFAICFLHTFPLHNAPSDTPICKNSIL